MNQKGLASIIILAIIVLVFTLIFYHSKQSKISTESQPSKTESKIYNLPDDLSQNVSGKILYLKTIKCSNKNENFCSYPQLLDFNKNQKALSDRFNNAQFIKSYFGDRFAIAWSSDGSKFVTQGNVAPLRSDYQPDKYHNDTEYEGKLYLYEIDSVYEALKSNQRNSYEPTLLQAIKTLNFGIDKISWSPDGKKLAYWTNHEDRHYETATNITTITLSLFDLATKQEKILLTIQGMNPTKYDALYAPVWSPDSSKILFLEQEEQKNDNSPSNTLKFIDTNTLKQETIIPPSYEPNSSNTEAIVNFDWVSNDAVIVNRLDHGVFVYNIKSKNTKQIITGTNAKYLSPNKKFIVFLGGYGNISGLEVVDISEGFTYPKVTKKYNYTAIEEFIKSRKYFIQFPQGLELRGSLYGDDNVVVWSPDSKFLDLTFVNHDGTSPSNWMLNIGNKKFIKIPQLENVSSLKWGM